MNSVCLARRECLEIKGLPVSRLSLSAPILTACPVYVITADLIELTGIHFVSCVHWDAVRSVDLPRVWLPDLVSGLIPWAGRVMS